VSGPLSVTKRTVTLSAEDLDAFRINRETSCSLEITLLLFLLFFPFEPPRRREANVLNVLSNCRDKVGELLIFGYNDGLQEDSLLLPIGYIDNECDGVVKDFILI